MVSFVAGIDTSVRSIIYLAQAALVIVIEGQFSALREQIGITCYDNQKP
jgi:hypothetical protein